MADTLDRESGQQAQPRSPWSVGKRVKAALLATAAAITGVWGAVKAIDEIPDKWEEWRTPASEMDRSPSLGLQVVQGEQQRPLLRTDSPDVIRVDMRRAAFHLLVPDVGEDTAVQVMASTDPAAGDVRPGTAVGDIPFFSPGTGMADSDFSSSQLVLTTEAHTYLIDQRLRRESDREVSAFFGTIGEPGAATPKPLREQRDDVHLVVLVNRDGDDVVDLGELERLLLDF